MKIAPAGRIGGARHDTTTVPTIVEQKPPAGAPATDRRGYATVTTKPKAVASSAQGQRHGGATEAKNERQFRVRDSRRQEVQHLRQVSLRMRRGRGRRRVRVGISDAHESLLDKPDVEQHAHISLPEVPEAHKAHGRKGTLYSIPPRFIHNGSFGEGNMPQV